MGPESRLLLEDGAEFRGRLFGACRPVGGEVVFNTGMVGYPEALTDPSYHGQILVLTYPLVGNYGVPGDERDELGLPRHFESERIQVRGLVVAELAHDTSHWTARRSLHRWLEEQGVTGLAGVDTRALARRLRSRGTMLGQIAPERADTGWDDPNRRNLVAEVSAPEVVDYGCDGPRVLLLDCGAKASIVRGLVAAGARVRRVPWNHDLRREEFDGLCLSNGPGDPRTCGAAVAAVRGALEGGVPTFGICLGNQLLALAAGADTYKLKFGHRSQNQPCVERDTRRCWITAQNHGYAVDASSLPEGWEAWLLNGHDGSVEGVRHRSRPFRGVQFHPEASPGPTDTGWLFADFVRSLA